MELDSNLSALLQTLTMADPLTAPRSWETIPSESGFSPEVRTKSGDPIHQSASITDAALVRLALQALQGIKSSLLQIEEISDEFSSIRADNTYLTNPNFWYRSSSTRSLSQLLKSILQTGLKVYFLQKFTNYFLLINPSFSLVNQAFTVSVKKLLEGYFCAFDTLSASVKLRRGDKNDYYGITLMEIYLHTEELRRYIESLGNICFPKFLGLDLNQEDLNTETLMDFNKFPKGADLLSYLYIQLRDADPVHYGLLKYLFIQSFEPYCEFIKLWIYQASLDDPYEEFFLAWANDLPHEKSQLVMERKNTTLPCFLSNSSQPIIRAGQQLNVLIKLLNLCNISDFGGTKLENILPCWFSGSHKNTFQLNSLIFSKERIEVLVSKREDLYKNLSNKLQSVVLKFDLRSKWVIPLHSINLISNEESLDIQSTDKTALSNEETESDELSFETQLETSSNSSDYYSEEEIESLEIQNSNSNLPPQNITACERLFSSQISSYLENKTIKDEKFIDQRNFEDQNPNEEIHASIEPQKDENNNNNNQLFKCWPLGSLNKNPFIFNNICLDSDQGLNEDFNEGFEPFVVMDSKYGSKSLEKLGFSGKSYNLSANPVLTKSTWLKNEDSRDKNGFLTPFFDFSTVTNPSDRFFPDPKYKLSVEKNLPFLKPNNNTNATETNKPVKTNIRNEIKMEINESSLKDNVEMKMEINESSLRDNVEIKMEINESSLKDDVEIKECDLTGGAQWTESLNFSNKNINLKCDESGGDSWQRSDSSCDLPLDIVIDKCIVQEILLQYKYVSNFTIKLLVEGFDLHEHFLSLRRYHFMEISDWADSLIASLFHKKWPISGTEQNAAEIQGFLESALQRSSCYSDSYKDRLFIYIKEKNSVPLCTSFSVGLGIFDSIMLGYRVEWPINIIINNEALKIYGEIFSYLGQIRFALFSLTYTWSSLKDIIKTKKRLDKMGELNSFIRIRQQIHHFVSTLQQYAHSQLSDVSWCRFQHSFKNQVKDMLDLESMHMSYLGEALHICFLSVETKPIAAILRNILQCAVDLRSCLPDKRCLNSLINFTEVSAVNMRFQAHLKELYVLYKNSPKHGELSLCRFWNYLDYNDYFSSTISRELGFLYF
ncbi:hypothetical protein LUZ60_001510 [Juncus effusus]|nr:hypothetical protein LUZ60_001510 [Juncus effusus]